MSVDVQGEKVNPNNTIMVGDYRLKQNPFMQQGGDAEPDES